MHAQHYTEYTSTPIVYHKNFVSIFVFTNFQNKIDKIKRKVFGQYHNESLIDDDIICYSNVTISSFYYLTSILIVFY